MKKLFGLVLCLFFVCEGFSTQLQDEDYAKIMAMTISETQHQNSFLRIGIVAKSKQRADSFKKIFQKIARLRSGSSRISYEIKWEKSPHTSEANILLQLDEGFVLPKHIFSIGTSKQMVKNGACLGIVVINTRPTILGNRDIIKSSKTRFDRAFQRFIQILNGEEL